MAVKRGPRSKPQKSEAEIAEELARERELKRRDAAKALLELVEKIHEEKKIGREVVFSGIESAIRLAAERHFQVEKGVLVQIDRATGEIIARHGEQDIDPETLGRIAAQSAKQVMIQKFREAESDTVFSEYNTKKGELIVGTIQRIDAGAAIVNLGKSEALLPRSEQIRGETHHIGQRIKAVVHEVRKTGHRVKIILSRASEEFVRALFQEEIPEIEDRTIDIRQIAREAGHRTKVAVSSIDSKVDCVGACVGVRGSRIKNIIEELNGERIDIVRWNESLQILIPNALSPAEISDVFTYPRLGRAIVLVNEDQLSLAIGRHGQNVRLASKLVNMELEIMTHDELGEALERAERWFRQLPGITEEQVQKIVEEGFLSYNEITYVDGEELTKFMPEMPLDVAEEIVAYAEEYADLMERAEEEERAQARAAAEEERARVAAALLTDPPATRPDDPESTEENDPTAAAVEPEQTDETVVAQTPTDLTGDRTTHAAEPEPTPETDLPPTANPEDNPETTPGTSA